MQHIFHQVHSGLLFSSNLQGHITGGADVLNVSFSEKGHEDNEVKSSRHLGILFFCVGFGCLIGPLIADHWTDMKNLITILDVCVVTYVIQAIGLLGMGYFDPFLMTCFFTIVRTAGSSIAWIDSSVILQVCR